MVSIAVSAALYVGRFLSACPCNICDPLPAADAEDPQRTFEEVFGLHGETHHKDGGIQYQTGQRHGRDGGQPQRAGVVVVINKVDKPAARVAEVYDEIIDLFIELGADDDQLEFPVCYTSAVNFTSSDNPDVTTQKKGMDPVLDMIINYIPAPNVNSDGSLQFQPALLDYNDFVGRIGIGRVSRGTIKNNEVVSCCRLDGSIKQFRIQKLFRNFNSI